MILLWFENLITNIFKLYIDLRPLSNSLDPLHEVVTMQREYGDHKHFLQHIFREVQFASVALCSELNFNVQIKYNISNIKEKELRMSRQDNLNLPFCALWHKFLTEPMYVTFWWLLSVPEDRVTIPLSLYYEPSARALIFLGLDSEAVSSNEWYFSYPA